MCLNPCDNFSEGFIVLGKEAIRCTTFPLFALLERLAYERSICRFNHRHRSIEPGLSIKSWRIDIKVLPPALKSLQ